MKKNLNTQSLERFSCDLKLSREWTFIAIVIVGIILSIAIVIVGVLLFYSSLNTWFYVSIIAFISVFGVSLAILTRGKKEERKRQMEERAQKLEAENEKEN